MTHMTHTPAPPRTLSERLDDLTGLEELIIEERFGVSVYDDWEAVLASVSDEGNRVSVKHMGRLKRMLLFVEKNRDLPADLAYGEVMGLTLREVNAALRLDELEETDEAPEGSAEPESPAGKSDANDANGAA